MELLGFFGPPVPNQIAVLPYPSTRWIILRSQQAWHWTHQLPGIRQRPLITLILRSIVGKHYDRKWLKSIERKNKPIIKYLSKLKADCPFWTWCQRSIGILHLPCSHSLKATSACQIPRHTDCPACKRKPDSRKGPMSQLQGKEMQLWIPSSSEHKSSHQIWSRVEMCSSQWTM